MGNLLFSIGFFHQYYDNGRLQNFSVVASEKTQQTLERYDLVAQLEQGVYSIYYLGKQKFSEFCESIQLLLKQQTLVFRIRSDAQKFTLISDLPLDWLGLLKYSSGDVGIQSSQSALMLPSLVERNDLRHGEVGEISISTQDLFDSHGEREKTNFEIRIDARETQWDYYVINASNVKMVDPRVCSRDGIYLDSPRRTSVGSNHNVLLFSSGKRHFAMTETAKHSFDLLNHCESKPIAIKTLLKGLPTPNTNEISIQPNSGQPNSGSGHACSKMYVYL